MTQRASARARLVAVAAMSVAESARAGVWSTEPVLGLQTDYSTNPNLVIADRTATVDGAVLIDAPTTYRANAWNFALRPTFRFTDNSGYSSLVSNYEHLTAAGEFDSERSSLTVTALTERESSLYQGYHFNGSIGVRQDTALADVAWIHALTERLNFNADVSYSRVRYGQSNGLATLTDYTYSSASPSFSWQASERTTLTMLGGFNLYNSLDGTTRSTDSNFEVGFVRQLSELWTLGAKAGVSRENNQIKEYFGPFLLGTFTSTNSGTVYSGNLTRQGTRLTTTATASRSLVPTGFAFLAHRDRYDLQASYQYSERWTLGGYIRYRREQNPQLFVLTVDTKYTDLGLSASWLMTEHWTVTVTASHIAEKYGPPDVHVAETALSVQLARKFNRIEWH
jgi:hypothetical protein